MTICINPRCPNPQNSDNVQFCESCGSSLLLKQRYRATKVLGEGGFGKTYEASDLGVTNKVIKVLINNSPKAVELFQREAEVLSQLNNPGIPKVEPNSYIIFHSPNSQEPIHCLVMEKIEGMNLREYLNRTGQPIDSETALRWLEELLLILQEVHQRGILHRDIKPQNIIFKPDCKLALIDFGAVKEGTGTELSTESVSGSGTEIASHVVAGTSIVSRGYTPSEQMNGEAMQQSDLYSLGRTFVFLLTKKEPLEISYDSYNDKLQWHNYVPNLDLKLAELLDKMQSTLVRQRPNNTQEILHELQQVQGFEKEKINIKSKLETSSNNSEEQNNSNTTVKSVSDDVALRKFNSSTWTLLRFMGIICYFLGAISLLGGISTYGIYVQNQGSGYAFNSGLMTAYIFFSVALFFTGWILFKITPIESKKS
jgi:serine/threonine protein kinase